MTGQAGRLGIASRPAVIDPRDREVAEALVRSIIPPSSADFQLGFALQMRLFAGAVLDGLPPPPPGRILVQEALAMESRDGIPPGQRVDVQGERLSTPDSHVFDLAAVRPQAAGETAALLTARIRLADPAIVGAQAARGGRRPDVDPLVATIAAEHLAAYADLSGDGNPIHTDLSLARALGLRERVVHGALLMFLIAPALASAGIGGVLRKVQMRFLGPAFAGDRLEFFAEGTAASRPGTTRARVLAVRPDGLICCAADAEVAGQE